MTLFFEFETATHKRGKSNKFANDPIKNYKNKIYTKSFEYLVLIVFHWNILCETENTNMEKYNSFYFKTIINFKTK